MWNVDGEGGLVINNKEFDNWLVVNGPVALIHHSFFREGLR